MKLEKKYQLYLLGILLLGAGWAALERRSRVDDINASYLIGTAFGFFLLMFLLGVIAYYIIRIFRKSMPKHSFLRSGIEFGFYAGAVFLVMYFFAEVK